MRGTPEELMLKALEVVKTGMGMPAFIGDRSYIGYLAGEGVSLQDARDYALAGCLDVNIPGKSRINAFGMFNVPLVFEIVMNNGVEPRTGRQLGPKTGDFESFKTFDDFMKAFKNTWPISWDWRQRSTTYCCRPRENSFLMRFIRR